MIYIRKFAHFEILKTIFKCQMLCQNARIKVLDSFLTRINMFMNKHWTYKKIMVSIMKKWGDLQLFLQLGFWIAMTIYNALQLNLFIWVWMLSDKWHELEWMQLTIGGTIYICNLFTTTMVMSCWCYFSFIHPNFTHGIMGIFAWIFFFEILISTIHYDCSFYMVLNYDTWHSWKLPHGILIEFWKTI
jgi:hypothetical protein